MRCIEIEFHKLILFNTFREGGGTIKDHFPFVHIPKAFRNDTVPTLLSPLNRAPPLLKSFRCPCFSILKVHFHLKLVRV